MTDVQPLNKVKSMVDQRIETGIAGFDNLIGGGFVPGTAIMLAGEPGMGKSTFLLQLAQGLAKNGNTILYISGEESAGQVKLRAERLGIDQPLIWISEDVQVDTLLEKLEDKSPDIIVIDSLQMVHEAEKLAGTPSQTQSALDKLLKIVKKEGSNKVLITIGHATKANTIAGRLTLQHMVDAIMFLRLADEMDGTRILHVKKNRFGESMVDWRVKMTEQGIVDAEAEVALQNPSPETPTTGAVLGMLVLAILVCSFIARFMRWV